MKVQGFQPVKDTKAYVKLLIYGHGGAGKTRFCADAPSPYWFDTERSTETLRNWPEYSHIPVKIPKDVDELRSDVTKLVKDPEVETIVLDSMTTMHDHFMRVRAHELVANARVHYNDPYAFRDADYKYATQVFTDLFDFLQHAPINVVLIGHERREYTLAEDKRTRILDGIYPDITPRLQDSVTRLVNVVAYMEVKPSQQKERTRKLYLNPTGLIEAKNRLNIQETFLTNPSWNDVFKNIQEV